MLDVSTKAARHNFYSSLTWKHKRIEILERDHYECQWCKEEGKVTTQFDSVLEIDHIKELEHHPELALENDNLRTLCKNCHNKRHKRFNFKESKRQKKWNDEWWG